MKRTVLFLFLLTLFFPSGTGLARSDAQILDSLKSHAQKVKTISSRFVQEKHLSVFDKKLESRGKFYFRNPDCLRWEYTAPYEQGFALCGDSGMQWDEISGEKEINAAGNPLWDTLSEQLIAWSRLDIDRLQEKYDISVREKDPLVLKLIPKTESMRGVISRLIIHMSEKKGVIKKIIFFEPDGDNTRIEFEDTQINTSPPEGIFHQ
ncbi:MAG: outer membrane lipoprotein carrier protein LolA [Thermodesulfobacteriota bacterium]